MGRIAGIDLRVHVTLVMLLAWLLTAFVLKGHNLSTALVGMLETMFARLKSCESCRSVPVVEHGRLVGIVTMDNITELLMVRQALG